MKRLLLALVALFAFAAADAAKPVKIIFDTDMGNDVDDVVALDMLYKYVDEGTIDLLGILSSKREGGSVKFIDAMNTLYGHPEIPIGIAKIYPEENYVDTSTSKRLNYADYVVANNTYKHTVKDWDALPDGYKLLRELLAKAEDKSVVVVAVGFSTNLDRMMQSKGDEFSPLGGRELFEQKVEKVVKPPQIPVFKNKIARGLRFCVRMERATIQPIAKQPIMLTMNVLRGNAYGSFNGNRATPYRAIAPMAPPKPTKSVFIIYATFLQCSFIFLIAQS